MQTTVDLLDQLPVGVRQHIFRFLSTPSADALRPITADYQEFETYLAKEQFESALNTFYMYHFSEQKLVRAMREASRIREQWGVELTIRERDLQPKLWRMYRRVQPSLFPFRPIADDGDDADFSDFDSIHPSARRRNNQTSRNTSTAHSRQHSSASHQRSLLNRPANSYTPLPRS